VAEGQAEGWACAEVASSVAVGAVEDLAGAEGLATEGAAGVDSGVAAPEAVADTDRQRSQRIFGALFCKCSLCCCLRYVTDILDVAVCVAVVMADDEQEVSVTVCTSMIHRFLRTQQDPHHGMLAYIGRCGLCIAKLFNVGVGLMPGIMQGRLAVL